MKRGRWTWTGVENSNQKFEENEKFPMKIWYNLYNLNRVGQVGQDFVNC